ncbi:MULTISPECIES: hypothetical protein [unclassified Streptomyces]|uniref:hypothetical protein n=1 Tax=unclassified Streptomyces TaxID=2593676 RepID=UPI000AF1E953
MPDEYATATVDVTAWLDQKWAAIRSHRSQLVSQRPLPALLSRLDGERRERILRTEYFTQLRMAPGAPGLRNLTP